MTAQPAAPPKAASGVGGWLLLFAGTLLLGPVVGAVRIGADLLAAERQYPVLQANDAWDTFKAALWCVEAAIALLSLAAGWGLVTSRRRAAVRRAGLVLWLTGPGGVLLMGLVVPATTLGETGAGRPLFVVSLAASVLGAGVWTGYLARSRRVRATYTEP